MDRGGESFSDTRPPARIMIYDLCTGRRPGGHQEDYLIALEQALAPWRPQTVAPFRFGQGAGTHSRLARLLRCFRDFTRWLHDPEPAWIIAPNVLAGEFLGLILAGCLPGRNRRSRILFVMRREAEGITSAGWRAKLLDWSVRSLARRGLMEMVSDTPQAATFWSERTGRPCALVTIPVRRPRQAVSVDGDPVFSLLGAFRVEKGARAYDASVEAALASDPSVRVEMQLGLQTDNPVEAQLAEDLQQRWGADPRVTIHRHLSGEAYTDLLYRTDVVILPYEAESYGLGSSGVLFEALAAGRMAIATPIKWAYAEYRDHPGVIWIDHADPQSLRAAAAEAVRRLPEWRRRPPPSASDDRFAQSWFAALTAGQAALPSQSAQPAVAPAPVLPPGTKAPNVLIVGAMKSYTTSLFEALRASPAVYCATVKEPNFFCTDLHDHPTFWLAKDSVINPARYARLFDGATDQHRYRLEASTNYLPSTTAAANIKAVSPDARIIILLRNPIERAWSEYKMNCARGDEVMPFLKAVSTEAEHARMQRPYLLRRYVTGGLYAEQVARYLDVFPRDQVLVEVVDRPGHTGVAVFAKVFAFLGIEATAPPPVHENAQVKPVFPILNALAYYSGVKILAARITSGPLKAAAKKLLYRSDRTRISDSDRQAVRGYFTDDIARLEVLLGVSLDHWK